MWSGWEWYIRNCVLLQLLQAVLVVYLYTQGGYVQFHSEGGEQQLHPFSVCKNFCHRKWILSQLMLCLRNDDWHLTLCISLFDCKRDLQRENRRCKCLPRWEWFLLSHRFVSEDMEPAAYGHGQIWVGCRKLVRKRLWSCSTGIALDISWGEITLPEVNVHWLNWRTSIISFRYNFFSWKFTYA